MSVTAAVEIVMPRLSDSMQEGTIVRWLKATGEAVAGGEAIVEIETDKATMDYEAEAGGVIEIVVPDGTTVPLGEVIARILPVGAAVPMARERRAPATPVARRIAAELGIDLASVRGTGRRGHVVKADVEAVAGNGGPQPGRSARQIANEIVDNAAARQPVTQIADKIVDNPAARRPVARIADKIVGNRRDEAGAGSVRREELTSVQRRIAARMVESRALVPDFTLEVEIEMDRCLALRAELAEHADPTPSINDMIVRACALALTEHPRVNAAYREEGFDLFERVNVGIAVAARDTLVVPVIHDADRKSVAEIARSSRELAERVRAGRITPAELSGATFTVSNLGMFGIARFTAVINPPQAAILAVGAVRPTAVVRGGELAVASTMAATLASDHRILYGADAAAFLRDVRKRLEAPMSLLV